MNYSNLLEISFALSGILLLLFYIPQMALVAKAKNPLQEVSLLTWGVWAIALFIYSLYGYYKLDDFKFTMLSLLSALNCSMIFFTTLYKRIKYRPQKPSHHHNGPHQFKKLRRV